MGSASSKSQSPQWRMASQQLKAVLSMYVIRPVVQAARSVCGFRMIWRGTTTGQQSLNCVWDKIIAHRLTLDALLQDLPGKEALIMSQFICLVVIFMSWQHLRSYQEEHRIVTVRTRGDFIVLPHWETQAAQLLYSIKQCIHLCVCMHASAASVNRFSRVLD